MGLSRDNLPDSLLRRISSADRKAAGLPPLLDQSLAAAVTRNDHKREKELQVQILNWLRLGGVTVLWSRTDKRLTATVGWPDLTFCWHGKPFAFEVKIPGGTLSEDQVRVRKGMIADGWNYSVVHSLDEARAAVAEA
jgi:hypothetical protein